MRKILILTLIACMTAFMASCGRSEDEKAAPLMHRIDSLYQAGDYPSALNAVTLLRAKFPKAIESRKRALTIWQDASLKMTQEDIGRTDSALQAVTRQFDAETDIGRRNRLGVLRDSLQVRYDALCGTVRVIHQRQKENHE